MRIKELKKGFNGLQRMIRNLLKYKFKYKYVWFKNLNF